MARIVVLPDWADRETEAPPDREPHPQWTGRFSRFPTRYPNTIRRYRLDHGWRQRDLAQRLGCSSSTVGSWEHGRTMPSGVRLLRLGKTLDTLVESLYYELYAAEKFFVLPRAQQPGARPPTAGSASTAELPHGVRIVSRSPRSWEAWWRGLLFAQFQNDTIRAKNVQAVNQEPLWLPVRRNGKPQPYRVPFAIWDQAPAHPKAIVMTAQWVRRYNATKGKAPAPEITRLAYVNYLDLFQRHYLALHRGVRSRKPIHRNIAKNAPPPP